MANIPPIDREDETHDIAMASPASPISQDYYWTPWYFHDDEPEPPAKPPVLGIPFEIFILIASHLERSDMKSLRLVCRKFNDRIIHSIFKNVVVPFRPGLYEDPAAGRGDATTLASRSSLLSCHGSGIFRKFGHFIKSFVLSLELDNAVLAWPPAKPNQIAVLTFWGFYRWPPKAYRRYEDLEDLERHADDLDGMKLALSFLSSVSNLGLSCDCGLGYLRLPDKGRSAATIHSPLGWHVKDVRRAWKTRKTKDSTIITVTDFRGAARVVDTASMGSNGYNYRMLEELLDDFAYPPSELREAVAMLLDTERKTLLDLQLDERWESDLSEQHSGPEPRRRRTVTLVHALRRAKLRHQGELLGGVHRPLIPTRLTRQQRELLVELQWAQAAMISSYLVAIMNNAAMGGLPFLTTLTLAKLPSCCLTDFCRRDLWTGLPTLSNVSLGVIPDWRTLTKSGWGSIVDRPVSPVEAVPLAFSLLHDFIGRQRNIEQLRFEWICGGELAPCLHQRNQYVVPAPFVRHPNSMVSTSTAFRPDEDLLDLPHIRHLSLKNCWASPHVLIQTIRDMALSSLEELELWSVSLSGPPTLVQQPNIDLQDMITPETIHDFMAQSADPLAIDLGPISPGSPPNDWPEISTNIPPVLSWAGFMDIFPPGPRLGDGVLSQSGLAGQDGELRWYERLFHAADFLPNVDSLSDEASRYKLRSIRFESCGHVFVDAAFIDSGAIMDFGTILDPIVKHDPLRMMQHCNDRLLARLILYFKHVQSLFLEAVFGMRFGRRRSVDVAVGADARADGWKMPGAGRFSGTLERPDRKPLRD